jgi:hypothetical protein
VTSNDWAPFTDENLLGGGMFVRIGATAMQRGGNDRGYEVSYVDDWMSHVDVLLPSGAFDMSIAWEGPDCSKLDMLGEFSVRMCTEFDFPCRSTRRPTRSTLFERQQVRQHP